MNRQSFASEILIRQKRRRRDWREQRMSSAFWSEMTHKQCQSTTKAPVGRWGDGDGEGGA